MQTVLIIIHLMVVLALIGVVLIQRSEGGGLGIGGGGGGGGFFTARGTANVLTRATAILATLFFLTSLGLTVLAGWGRGPSTIFTTPATLPSGAPAPGATVPNGNVLQQLQGAQPAPGTAPAPAEGTQAPAEGSSAPAAPAPAAPAAPATPQVPQSQ